MYETEEHERSTMAYSSRAHASPPQSSAGSRGLRILRWTLLCLFLALPVAGSLLTFLEVFVDGVGGVEGLAGANDVTVSPEGRHVYVASALDNAVAVFIRDATGDTLSFASASANGVGGLFGMEGASGIAVSPDGAHVYVTAEIDGSLVVFSRSATLDDLSFVSIEQEGLGGVSGLANASSVAVSPDGNNVYTTGAGVGNLAIFTRSATLDDLAFVDVLVDDVGGIDGLANAQAVAVSPNGEDVYVVGPADNALAHFLRDSQGNLTFENVYRNGGGISGLAGAYDVAVSPDSRFVYVASIRAHTVVVFERNPVTAELDFVAVYRDGAGGIDGLEGASSVSVSPDGKRVSVTGALESTLAAFARDPSSGTLSPIRVFRDGEDGIDGLLGAMGVTDSPDAQNVFVTGTLDDALAAFTILLFGDGFESGDTTAWSVTVP